MLFQEYPKLGSLFTQRFQNKSNTFCIVLEVSSHFFKAMDAEVVFLMDNQAVASVRKLFYDPFVRIGSILVVVTDFRAMKMVDFFKIK